jgi:transcription factor E
VPWHGKVFKRIKFLLDMQVKLLHNLVEEMAGLDTGRIVDILFNKKDVNEFLIAKKMELTINQVRNILYKLSAEGLVSFIRKKDKRKGWYIYYWTLNSEKCLVKLEQSLLRKIEGLQGVLGSRETKRFYICNSCDIEVGEEKALEHGFSCEECAEIYELSDNSGPIRDTKAKMTRTEKDLKLIQSELEIVREKKAKKRARADKKAKIIADAEKAEKRAKAAKERAKKKAEALKASGGKEVVKKVKKKLTKKKKAVKKKAKKVVAKVKKKVSAKKKTVKKAVKKAVKKKSKILGKFKKAVKNKLKGK